MSNKNITRMSLRQALKSKGQTNWERFDKIDPEEAPIDFDWENAEIMPIPIKRMVSIRLDNDVLEYFKSTGKGYQTRINQVLSSYVNAKRTG